MSLSSHALLRSWYSHAQDELKAIFRSQRLLVPPEVPEGVASAGYVLDVLARSSRPEKRLCVSGSTRLVGQEVGSEDLVSSIVLTPRGCLSHGRPGTGFSGAHSFCYSCIVGSTKAAGRTRFWELCKALLSLSLLYCLSGEVETRLLSFSPTYLLITWLLRFARSLTSKNHVIYMFDAVNKTIMATATTQDIISPVTTEKPELIVSAPSINSEPVELDSTPTSPDKVRTRRASRDELLAELDEEEKEVSILT
jgi:hypothetical protein